MSNTFNGMTAQDLLDKLNEVKLEWGTLDVPIDVFSKHFPSGDRIGIMDLDVFDDNTHQKLHSIDINLVS